MDLFVQYLQEFNREYLSTREDRRRVRETLVTFAATLVLIMITAVVLWAL
jgi:predicted nucleic acid-binding Zn ribbon protein